MAIPLETSELGVFHGLGLVDGIPRKYSSGGRWSSCKKIQREGCWSLPPLGILKINYDG